MTDYCKSIIEFLDCEYELFENEADSNKIINCWTALVEQGTSEGFFPLIVIASDVLAETLEFVFDDYDIDNTKEGLDAFRKTVIADAENIDVNSFLSQRLNKYMETYNDMDIMGEFKKCKPDHDFHCLDNSLNPHPEIFIAKIRTENPWEMAAWLPMGGFNDCPTPAEQTAVFKLWYEKYGAVPGVVTYDNWELKLTNPPVTNETAEEVAKEQFAFCCDIVEQASDGWDTIRALASLLKDSTTWFFWWD